MKKITFLLLLLASTVEISGCLTFRTKDQTPVDLPFIKNAANECYFLDEFMPLPDALTSGRSDGLNLRYYTYKMARYKELDGKPIVLAFYSRDDHCWSLYEEYYVVSPD